MRWLIGLMSMRVFVGLSLISVPIMPAYALCIYHGANNARTTIEQEFVDSRWVVRAHVVSADYHWSDEDESWTLYRLKVIQSFKGKLHQRFTLFTTRDSGGFYMDGKGGVPDLDGDYLLFLTPSPWRPTYLQVAKGALWINYNCGQSKAWLQVTQKEKTQLQSLSPRR
jgi:hypothetical protein